MKRVMLVDDSAIVTKMVSKYLSERGYEVEVTNSPFGVTGRLKEYMPDVVLMDLGLPGLSGEKLLELCRGNKECSATKIVLFSSSDEQKMKDLVSGGLAHDYFMKGGSLQDLENKIRA